MPHGTKNVEKVNPRNFPKIKKYIAEHGDTAAHEDLGYSLGTVRSIRKTAEYETWREKRRARQGRKKPAAVTPAQTAVQQPQAIQPVARPQSVTTVVVKKPGHGRTHATDSHLFVTSEKAELDLDESFEEIQEEIIREDRKRKSRWQRIKESVAGRWGF